MDNYIYIMLCMFVCIIFIFWSTALGRASKLGQVEPGHRWQQIALSHARISNLGLIQVLHSLGLGENQNRKPCFSMFFP